MKISSVQNYSYTPNYKGSFNKDYAFREFHKSLVGTEKDTFETIIKNIENTKDDNWWWFDFKKIHGGAIKLAIIGKLNPDGTPRYPGYFLDDEKNALKLFKKLAEWYKNNVEGYKE